MKRILLIILLWCSFVPVFAKHIIGGEIIYKNTGAASGARVYTVTLRLFRDALNCNAANNCAVLPPSVTLGIYNNDNNQRTGYKAVNQSGFSSDLPVVSKPPCLTNEPEFSYEEADYSFQVSLPDNSRGYTITYQTCCRVLGIANGGSSEGATYSAVVPGTDILGGALHDNSAAFQTGISVICYHHPFKLDFSATDPDHDSLVYSFVDAYNGGAAQNSGFAQPAAPPYGSITYYSPFSGTSPLGSLATINTATGFITGIAPDAGKYVVSVAVKSYRNGVFIAEHRKDFIVTVAPCDFASAELPEVIRSCDTYDKTFSNLNNSPLNITYYWNFGDPASGSANTSASEIAFHHYSDTGVFVLTLIVNAGQICGDTAYAKVLVYPGFVPAFAPIPDRCVNLPVQFHDQTTATFGTTNYWRWDFGDPTTSADTSHLKDPVYTYNLPGTYNVQYIVQTDKGCRDTLYPVVNIIAKPDFRIFPKDTLICVIDTLQIRTNVTTGSIAWSPNYMISDVHSFNPFVSPDVTTTYAAFYNDPYGCSITDSVRVRAVNNVSLATQGDTTICRTDSAVLHITTDALYFTWTPAALITDPNVKNPTVYPIDPSTDFQVHAAISAKCFKDATINVRTVPYPVPNIDGAAEICFGNSDTLHASGGSIYEWSPIAYLNNPHIADPISVHPKADIIYTVTVRDVLGCPKPVSKSFSVKVVRIIADAGPRDTSVVLGEQLQLNATGGTIYLWTPGTYLDHNDIASPLSLPQNNIAYNVRVSDLAGCFDNDSIRVHVYFLPPDLYVPSAFTPGKDNLNDVFRPIALGIRTLEFFRVYNRWGTMIYQTSRLGQGWDGSYNGKPQDSATFVWEVSAVDYKGKKIYRKGNVILIR